MNKNDKLRQQVNEILQKLDSRDFDEPINWGNICCAEAHFTKKGNIVIHIEEAAPDCQYFHFVVYCEMSKLYPKSKITVKTEW